MLRSTPPFEHVLASPVTPVAFCGRAKPFLRVLLKNIGLTVVTLGVHLPWAKTAIRRFVVESVAIGGQRLRYTGTGAEMLRGILTAGLPILLLTLLFRALCWFVPDTCTFALITFMLLLVTLFPVAVYWSLAYRLSRTYWRGIQFGLVPEARDFIREYFIGLALTLATVGIYAPIWRDRMFRMLINNARYGVEPFLYDADPRTIWTISMKGFLLSLVTLGFYYPWYRAELLRYRLGRIRIGQATLAFDMPGPTCFKLYALYVCGKVLTLGLAHPWLYPFVMRRALQHLRLEGRIDFPAIVQRFTKASADGEGLVHALDIRIGV